MATLIWRW